MWAGGGFYCLIQVKHKSHVRATGNSQAQHFPIGIFASLIKDFLIKKCKCDFFFLFGAKDNNDLISDLIKHTVSELS